MKLWTLTSLSVTDCEEHCLPIDSTKSVLNNVKVIGLFGWLIDWLIDCVQFWRTLLLSRGLEEKVSGGKWFMMSVVLIQSEVRQEERGRAERQTGRSRSSVTLCQLFLCNLSCGVRLGLISAKYYTWKRRMEALFRIKEVTGKHKNRMLSVNKTVYFFWCGIFALFFRTNCLLNGGLLRHIFVTCCQCWAS